MSLRIVQTGSGNPRPLVLIYHLNERVDPALRAAAGSSALIVNDTTSGSDYSNTPPLDQTIQTLRQMTGASNFSPILVVGFSAGGWATKRILEQGGDPDAVVVADGTYATSPDGWAAWQRYAELAKVRKRAFVTSNTSLLVPSSTWHVLSAIAGTTLPLGAVAGRPADAPLIQGAGPARYENGNFVILSYPTNDMPGHLYQGDVVLPAMIAEALSKVSGSRKAGAVFAVLAGIFAAGSFAYFLHAQRATPRLAFRTNPVIEPCGLCFPYTLESARAWLREMRDEALWRRKQNNITIVHGRARHLSGPVEGQDYAHAWVETGSGFAHDWQMQQKGEQPIPVADFYARYRPEHCVRYTPSQAIRMARKYGHPGPWVEWWEDPNAKPRDPCVIKNPIEFVDQGLSPMSAAAKVPGTDPSDLYPHAEYVYRFALVDADAPPVPPGMRYFVPTTRTVRTSPKGRALKKPRQVTLAGAAPDTVAFVDFHPLMPDGMYVDYVRVRTDLQGRGLANVVMRGFYDRVVLPKGVTYVHWGRVMNEKAWAVLLKMQTDYPSVRTTGNIYF